MKKYYIYMLMALSTVGFVSCNDDDEILEPSVGYVDNKFAVPEDATGPEAELRRSFYNRTGVFLMYDDLLSREYLGLDANGKEIWKEERIDFLYNFTDVDFDAPKFVFIETQEEKQAAADLIEEYIMPRIEGGKLSPFSILAVKSMQVYLPLANSWKYEYQDAYTTSCWRCRAIATDKWMQAEGAEKEAITIEVLQALLSDKFTYKSTEAAEFIAVGEDYHDEYLDDIFDDWAEDNDISRVHELGFLSYVESSYWGDYLPSSSEDFDAFFDIIFSMDESEFMEKYGEYSIIVAKYNLMKNAIISMGFKF